MSIVRGKQTAYDPTQSRTKSGRQHPILRQVEEEFGMATPGVAYGLMQITSFQEHGVEVTPEIVRSVVQKAIDLQTRGDAARDQRDAERDTPKEAVVYYIRLGNRVKIGTTTRIATRSKAVGCEEVMALEPGSYALEKKRHDQFRPLRVTGEWFRLEEPLIAHIEELRRAEDHAA